MAGACGFGHELPGPNEYGLPEGVAQRRMMQSASALMHILWRLGLDLYRKVLPQLVPQLADLGQEAIVPDGRLDQVDVHLAGKRPRQLP
ncbi:hypothetical protein QFZ70_002369 [Arthrobacter sp. V1I9]|nr:hypothetical protein [Arthrobacter sp. V1I9]